MAKETVKEPAQAKEQPAQAKTSQDLQISSVLDLQTNFKDIAEQHLALRFANKPEFKAEFIKTFSDFIFSQDDEMLEKISKTRQNTLMNAMFKATEAGASFAKKEVSFIPFKIFKKVIEKGVEKKIETGEFDAMVIFDINFQKQQVLKLKNCKRFFTSEVHEGVEILENLETGNVEFEGKNDVTKPTIGYYAVFITTEGERYDRFMTTSEIIDRAKFSPQFKADNYKSINNNIHFEKVVVRNLMKEIPKISDELKSIMSVDESYSDYVEVHEAIEAPKKTNQLEEAKKELAKEKEAPEVEFEKESSKAKEVKKPKEAKEAKEVTPPVEENQYF